MRWTTKIVLDVDFGEAGRGQDITLDGWGVPEPVHTWSIGRRSRLRLPPLAAGYAYTLCIRVQPWLHPPQVAAQTIVLGLDDRLLATAVLTEDCALAFDLPSVPRAAGGHRLSIDHLDSARAAAIDRYANGHSMGVMMRSLRLIRRRPPPPMAAAFLPPIPGAIADGTLVANLERRTGSDVTQVLENFECLGRWCGLGLLQERFGVNHVSLLRYAGLDMAHLTEGLFRRFDGIGTPGHVSVFNPDGHRDAWDVHESQYQVWWHTPRRAARATAARIEAAEHIRLPFLQRKLAETMASSQKIFVLPTAETEPEVLAVHNALDIRGPNTLLHVTQSGIMPPGSVWRVRDGLLCGRVDHTAALDRGTDDVWLSVLGNAYRMTFGKDIPR